MHYLYRIAGRTHSVVDQIIHEGAVTADTPKQAMIRALAAEYGDADVTDPIVSLTGTGWIDRSLLDENLDDLDEEDSRMELQVEEHSYVVEVRPVKGNVTVHGPKLGLFSWPRIG